MGVTLVIYLAIAIAIFAVKKKIDHITHTVEQKIEFVQNIATDPARIAVSIGTAVAGKALSKASKILKRK